MWGRKELLFFYAWSTMTIISRQGVGGHIICHYFVVSGRSEVDRARAGAGRLGFPQVEVPPVHLPEGEYICLSIYLSLYISIYIYIYTCMSVVPSFPHYMALLRYCLRFQKLRGLTECIWGWALRCTLQSVIKSNFLRFNCFSFPVFHLAEDWFCCFFAFLFFLSFFGGDWFCHFLLSLKKKNPPILFFSFFSPPFQFVMKLFVPVLV